MNYRQWKKQYKKEYGYNPPIVADKRKLRKKAVKNFIKAWKKISKKMIEISEKLTDIIKNVN